MIHFVFLLGCFITVLLAQTLLLRIVSSQTEWNEKRSLPLLALSLPTIALIFFAVWMLPEVLLTPIHGVLPQNWEWFLLWGMMTVPLLLLGLSFLLNVVRLLSLCLRVHCLSWEAPAALKAEETGDDYPANFSVRIWYHARPFAFTIPALWPGTKAVVILSTTLVERLDTDELHAVLWHETGHIYRSDFWITWLATWWRDAFFYLPSSWTFLHVLQERQERSCDAWVATVRGKDTTLALASALLKIWEDLLQGERKSIPVTPHAPGLASETHPGFTEQRVRLLIEHANKPRNHPAPGRDIAHWRAMCALVGIIVAWFCVVITIHLLLLSLGCHLSFPVLLETAQKV